MNLSAVDAARRIPEGVLSVRGRRAREAGPARWPPAPPERGINNLPVEYEYVKLS